ncbi:MAG: PEP-CTERM sorting domain-containing protein [Sedimentisphaerales bacterium]|nr:PEP-CTERM sorting domain-containing protein [Sedimentisphaerales bacterium]
MMKKLLIFCLTLSTTQLALAIPYFRIAPEDEKSWEYFPSDIITIQLCDNGQVVGFAIDAITDHGAGGTALEPQVFNPVLGYNFPGTLDSNGLLIEYIAAYNTSVPQIPTTGVLYSFEYHIPYSPYQLVYIDTFADGDMYLLPCFTYADGSHYEGHLPSLFIDTIVPEPATLALLALGALLLKRRS